MQRGPCGTDSMRDIRNRTTFDDIQWEWSMTIVEPTCALIDVNLRFDLHSYDHDTKANIHEGTVMMRIR